MRKRIVGVRKLPPVKSIWRKLLEFLNSYSVGEEFKRTDLLESLQGYKPDTAELYLYGLRKTGFVKRVERATYRIMYNIPDSLTTSVLQDVKSAKTWKSWFIPLHKRLGIDKSECPKQEPGLYTEY